MKSEDMHAKNYSNNNPAERRNSHDSALARLLIDKNSKNGNEQIKTRKNQNVGLLQSSTNSVSLKLRSASPSSEPSTSTHSSPSSLSVAAIQTHSPSKSSSDCIPTSKTLLSEVVTHKEPIISIKSDSKSANKQPELNNSPKAAVLTSNVMLNHKKTSSESPSSSSSISLATTATTTTATLLSSDLTSKTLAIDSNGSIKKSSSKSDVSEKKRKGTSSSRQKKFHRQFQQVSPDEQVLNYFTCALVSDILLQGYLYITENYFAFYSNVFGYVTKLLIPVTSVKKISKEKTVKIFPNAIAVCTGDERHVFSSFLSRETAYQLMISVWQDAVIHLQFQSTSLISTTTTTSGPVIDASSSASTDTLLPKSNNESDVVITSTTSTTETVHSSLRRTNNERLDVSELDDDSSSAVSGNESVRKRFLEQDQQIRLIEQQMNSGEIIQQSASIIPVFQLDTLKSRGLSFIKKFQSKIPQNVPVIYFGLSLVIILALLAWFLLYRISELRSNQIFAVDDLDDELPSNLKMYAELLKWQKDMQSQKVQLTQNVLNTNLEQISKISDNLEKLSKLIFTNKNNEIDDDISSIVGECDTNDSSAANDICS